MITPSPSEEINRMWAIIEIVVLPEESFKKVHIEGLLNQTFLQRGMIAEKLTGIFHCNPRYACWRNYLQEVCCFSCPFHRFSATLLCEKIRKWFIRRKLICVHSHTLPSSQEEFDNLRVVPYMEQERRPVNTAGGLAGRGRGPSSLFCNCGWSCVPTGPGHRTQVFNHLSRCG